MAKKKTTMYHTSRQFSWVEENTVSIVELVEYITEYLLNYHEIYIESELKDFVVYISGQTTDEQALLFAKNLHNVDEESADDTDKVIEEIVRNYLQTIKIDIEYIENNFHTKLN